MALTLLAANNAQSVLAAGINATATSLTVNTGTGNLFPTPVAGTSFFKLTLVDAATGTLTEIVHVTARVGDVMTIVRAQEGTTARIWSVNDIVANMLTAGTLQLYAQKDQALLIANNLSEIAAAGPTAVAQALANLGLKGAAKLSAATLTIVSATSFRINLPLLLGGIETSLILQAYRATSNSNVTMTTVSHPVAFPVAALAFWSIDITDAAAYNLTSTASPYLQAARTCYNNLTATGVDVGGDKDIFVFVLGY